MVDELTRIHALFQELRGQKVRNDNPAISFNDLDNLLKRFRGVDGDE